jgi:hypothetical protein
MCRCMSDATHLTSWLQAARELLVGQRLLVAITRVDVEKDTVGNIITCTKLVHRESDPRPINHSEGLCAMTGW